MCVTGIVVVVDNYYTKRHYYLVVVCTNTHMRAKETNTINPNSIIVESSLYSISLFHS